MKHTIKAIFLFYISLPLNVFSESSSLCYLDYEKVSKFVQLTNSSIYKKWMRPQTPTYVNVSIEMNSMASVKEVDSSYMISILMDMEWEDPRLRLNVSDCDPNQRITIEGSDWHLDRIWSPKIRVPDNKNLAALDRDAKIILLRVERDGFVRLRKRLNLDIFCRMDFEKYPFDNQDCRVSFISSDLSQDYLILDWAENDPFIQDENFFQTDFDVSLISLEKGNKSSKNEHFSCVSVILNLDRKWGHYLLDIYLPTTLIVVVSWISFWMEISVPPARITIGVTTMLTLVTVAKEARDSLPSINYINALDIWFVICTGFIFLSLVEFAIVSYISRAEKRKLRDKKRLRRNLSNLSTISRETQLTFSENNINSYLCPPNNTISSTNYDGIEILVPKSPNPSMKLSPISPKKDSFKKIKLTVTPPDSANEKTKEVYNPFKMTPQELAEYIDRKCRLLFPVFFLLLNIIYWMYICFT